MITWWFSVAIPVVGTISWNRVRYSLIAVRTQAMYHRVVPQTWAWRVAPPKWHRKKNEKIPFGSLWYSKMALERPPIDDLPSENSISAAKFDYQKIHQIPSDSIRFRVSELQGPGATVAEAGDRGDDSWTVRKPMRSSKKIQKSEEISGIKSFSWMWMPLNANVFFLGLAWYCSWIWSGLLPRHIAPPSKAPFHFQVGVVVPLGKWRALPRKMWHDVVTVAETWKQLAVCSHGSTYLFIFP